MMAELEIKNLTKVFPRRKQSLLARLKGVSASSQTVAVNQLSFCIEHGQFVVILGESGCGKTTLLRMIAGLEEPTSGGIYMDGENITDVYPEDREMAMVFQNYALYSHLNVHDNLAFPLRTQHVLPDEVEERVREVSSLLELDDLLEKKPRELSGGEQQRVSIGRAIIRRPKLFLMDEPFSNLDAPLRARLREHVKRLHTQLGITFIYVTHDQWDALTMGTRVILMHQGMMIEDASPQQIYRKPANVTVAQFIGQPPMNLCRHAVLVLREDTWYLQAFGSSFPLGKASSLSLRAQDHERKIIAGIRPVHCTIQTEGILATLRVSERVNAEEHLHLMLQDDEIIAVTEAGSSTYFRGQHLFVHLDSQKFHLFDLHTGNRIEISG